MRATSTFWYYVDHVVLDGAIRQGGLLTAGQRIGTSPAVGFGVDLGVVNDPGREARLALKAVREGAQRSTAGA